MNNFIYFHRQNGKAFRERTGAFRKVVKKYAELGKLFFICMTSQNVFFIYFATGLTTV